MHRRTCEGKSEASLGRTGCRWSAAIPTYPYRYLYRYPYRYLYRTPKSSERCDASLAERAFYFTLYTLLAERAATGAGHGVSRLHRRWRRHVLHAICNHVRVRVSPDERSEFEHGHKASQVSDLVLWVAAVLEA